MASECCANPSYLGADPRGGITECQDGHVLGPVQPVHCHLGAGGPFHHGDVVVPANTHTQKPDHNAAILSCHMAELQANRPGESCGFREHHVLMYPDCFMYGFQPLKMTFLGLSRCFICHFWKLFSKKRRIQR